MLAVGTSNGQVKLLDPSDGKVRFDVVGHQVHIVCSVAISPDGKQIATSGDGHFTKVWDATDGTERLQLRGHDGSSGCRCVVQTADKYPFLDRVVIEGCPVVAHSARVTAIAWSPCGRRIATGGSDKSVVGGKGGTRTVCRKQARPQARDQAARHAAERGGTQAARQLPPL